MPAFKDITGKRFGRLIAISHMKIPPYRGYYWLCRCDCGNTTKVKTGALNYGSTKSCGCLSPDTARATHTRHGMSHSPEYETWKHMKSRCFSKTDPAYKHYGGRGITVCRRWRKSFQAFYLDMGQRPSEGHSIDRIDVDGPYSPENCRWTTQSEQMHNLRQRKTFRTGVYPRKDGQYRAQISVDNKSMHLGVFSSYFDACAARASAEARYW